MKEENLKDNDNMEIYEIGYHLMPILSEEEVSKELSKIHSLLSENEASLIAESAPTMRQLSYAIGKKIETKINKFSKAYFGWIKFETQKSKIEMINKVVKENQNILRFIIVKTIRDNTLYVPKAPVFKKENHSEEKENKNKEETEKPEISETEIDKSIDELIIS